MRAGPGICLRSLGDQERPTGQHQWSVLAQRPTGRVGFWSGQVSGAVGRMFSEEESCLGPQEQLWPPTPRSGKPRADPGPCTRPVVRLPIVSASQQLLGNVPPPSLGKAVGGLYLPPSC